MNLQQLVDTAIRLVKFSHGHRPAKIEPGTTPDGTIFVKDNGIGFQMQYADQLLEPFSSCTRS